VVEDETLIRLDAIAFIEEAGFDVIEAVRPDEAIRILESRQDSRSY
jgi:DNA-binding response OmpR family regulator